MAPDFSSARIAKRSDSPYEPGKRSVLWQKYRLNLQQEFVIGGYTRGTNCFDALIIGFYQRLAFRRPRSRRIYPGDQARRLSTTQRPKNHQMPFRSPAPKG